MKKIIGIALMVCVSLASWAVYASVQSAKQKQLEEERIAAESREQEIARAQKEAENRRKIEKVKQIDADLKEELSRRKSDRELAAQRREVEFALSDDSQDDSKIYEFKRNELILDQKGLEGDLELIKKADALKEKILSE